MSAPLVMAPSTELMTALLSVEIPGAALAHAVQSANAIWRAGAEAGGKAAFDSLMSMAQEDSPPPDATVQRSGTKTSAPYAACLNAVNAAGEGHDVLAPALFASLAVAEMLQLTARQFVEAFAIGAEVSVRLAAAFAAPDVRRFIPASAVGQLGATLSVCRALGLDRTVAASALGLSAVQVTGNAPSGTAAYHLSVGNAARVGVESAFIASVGANGPQNAAIAIGLMINAPEIEEHLTGLGTVWAGAGAQGDSGPGVDTLIPDLRALLTPLRG